MFGDEDANQWSAGGPPTPGGTGGPPVVPGGPPAPGGTSGPPVVPGGPPGTFSRSEPLRECALHIPRPRCASGAFSDRQNAMGRSTSVARLRREGSLREMFPAGRRKLRASGPFHPWRERRNPIFSPDLPARSSRRKNGYATQPSSDFLIFASSRFLPMKTSWLCRFSVFSQRRSQRSVKRLFTPWKMARRGFPAMFRKPLLR